MQVKSTSRYKTSDGKIFDTREDANAHEKTLNPNYRDETKALDGRGKRRNRVNPEIRQTKVYRTKDGQSFKDYNKAKVHTASLDNGFVGKPLPTQNIPITGALKMKELLAHAHLGEHFWPWIAFLKTCYGLYLSDKEQELFEQCTNRTTPPTKAANIIALVVGRQAGKSAIAALVAVFEACFRDWRSNRKLAPGARPTVLILAADKQQAAVVRNYCYALLDESPLLKPMIVRSNDTMIYLSNGLVIEVVQNSFRNVRGRSVACCICDELCFWRNDESANPDTEVLNALYPAQAVFADDAKLILLSSPYVRKGVLFDLWEQYYGKDDPRHLVWWASTRTMNPTVPQEWIDNEYRKDALIRASRMQRPLS